MYEEATSDADGTEFRLCDRLLVRVPEAEEILAISRSHVYRLVEAGDLTAVHIGRSCRVTVQSLHDFVDRLVQDVKAGDSGER
jgi:excisionase family DNA binding protein